MAKPEDWYYRNDGDWLSEHPEPMQDDESELECEIIEWQGCTDWGELIFTAICLDCGNALTGRFCEVC